MTENIRILLVGGGKMGEAMLAGWKDSIGLHQSAVIEPASIDLSTYGAEVVRSLDALSDDFSPDVVFFAVKPQVMDEVLPAYQRFLDDDVLFVSIAAGIDIAFLESHLGKEAAIVRAMPNLGATVGKSVSVGVANSHVTDVQKNVFVALFEAVGQVTWLEDESQLDAVTAVSGSGPAYVFYFIECFRDAALGLGLDPALVDFLVEHTVTGSVDLALKGTSGVDDLVELRERVTSPGGTTEAALAVLKHDAVFKKLLSEAVNAAKLRSEELG